MFYFVPRGHSLAEWWRYSSFLSPFNPFHLSAAPFEPAAQQATSKALAAILDVAL
jgi:hypothetical protein